MKKIILMIFLIISINIISLSEGITNKDFTSNPAKLNKAANINIQVMQWIEAFLITPDYGLILSWSEKKNDGKNYSVNKGAILDSPFSSGEQWYDGDSANWIGGDGFGEYLGTFMVHSNGALKLNALIDTDKTAQSLIKTIGNMYFVKRVEIQKKDYPISPIDFKTYTLPETKLEYGNFQPPYVSRGSDGKVAMDILDNVWNNRYYYDLRMVFHIPKDFKAEKDLLLSFTIRFEPTVRFN